MNKISSSKKVFFFSIFSLFFLMNTCLYADNRKSSAPYISGDSFRSICDYLFDETDTSFDPQVVKQGSIIFVKTDMLGRFFREKHEQIANPYVLVSHNSDDSAPGEFSHFLDDPKLLKWFAQNVEDSSHPKICSIPIGVANQYWQHGSVKIIQNAQERSSKIKNDRLCYLNISVQNYPKERQPVQDYFFSKSYIFNAPNKSFNKYLHDLSRSKFVISPRGNGLDCHRTWEALYMGALPIVKTSSLDSLYSELPVIIVKDWNEITEDFLRKRWSKMNHLLRNPRKIYFNFGKIKSIQKQVKMNLIKSSLSLLIIHLGLLLPNLTWASQLDYCIAPEIKNDIFYDLLYKVAKYDDVKTILEIGSSSGDGSTDALARAIEHKDTDSELFCIELSVPRFNELKRRYEDRNDIICYNVSTVPVKDFPKKKEIIRFLSSVKSPLNCFGKVEVLRWLKQDIDYLKSSHLPTNGIELIKKDNAIDEFDFVLIDGSEFTGKAELDLIYGAKYIFLDDILTFKNYESYHRLLKDKSYLLVTEDKTLRHGFALFKRQ